MPEVGLLPVWLTNQGIKSMEALLTYAETGELLVDIRNTADLLVDPRDVQAELPPQ